MSLTNTLSHREILEILYETHWVLLETLFDTHRALLEALFEVHRAIVNTLFETTQGGLVNPILRINRVLLETLFETHRVLLETLFGGRLREAADPRPALAPRPCHRSAQAGAAT